MRDVISVIHSSCKRIPLCVYFINTIANIVIILITGYNLKKSSKKIIVIAPHTLDYIILGKNIKIKELCSKR